MKAYISEILGERDLFSLSWVQPVAAWLAFGAGLLWFWRVDDLTTAVPAYGDVLEVIWGILWYNETLMHGQSPFFYPLVFHPAGWQVGTLAHTPFIFTLAQPFYWLGGAAFAYNVLALIPFFISFAGTRRFLQIYTSEIPAVAGALVFTFMSSHAGRAQGHLNVLWAISILPCFAWQLAEWRRAETGRAARHILILGLIWGSMINFSLYSVFLAPPLFFLLGKQLFNPRKWVHVLLIGMVAAGFGSISLLPYYFASRTTGVNSASIGELVWWGASVDSIFIPNVYHPFTNIQKFARATYEGPYTEAGAINLGLTTLALLLVGLYACYKHKQNGRLGLLWVGLIGLILACGPLVKVDGEAVQVDAARPLNREIWALGQTLKPEVFVQDTPPYPYTEGIPLPGYLFSAVVPFWESARTSARFVIVAGLALIGLAAVGLSILPKPVRYLLIAVWFIETLPQPVNDYYLTLDHLHPAYEWIKAHALQGEGIVDLTSDPVQRGLSHGGEILIASRLTGVPTASSIGSFLPAHTTFLRDHTGRLGADARLAHVLRAFKVRYVLFHGSLSGWQEVWHTFEASPDFEAVGCFEPMATQPIWRWPICIAKVLEPAPLVDVQPAYGWSPPEAWGTWSIAEAPRARFAAAQQKALHLEAEAFPFCIDGRSQTITIKVNGHALEEYTWPNCDPHTFQVNIPADIVEIGWNELTFDYAYAVTPAEIEGSQNSDPRRLAVAFTKLIVR